MDQDTSNLMQLLDAVDEITRDGGPDIPPLPFASAISPPFTSPVLPPVVRFPDPPVVGLPEPPVVRLPEPPPGIPPGLGFGGYGIPASGGSRHPPSAAAGAVPGHGFGAALGDGAAGGRGGSRRPASAAVLRNPLFDESDDEAIDGSIGSRRPPAAAAAAASDATLGHGFSGALSDGAAAGNGASRRPTSAAAGPRTPSGFALPGPPPPLPPTRPRSGSLSTMGGNRTGASRLASLGMYKHVNAVSAYWV